MLIFVRIQRVLLKVEITRSGLQRDRREGRMMILKKGRKEMRYER